MAPLHVFLLSFLCTIVSAHFSLKYPPARGDSFIPPASQWIYPCANINATENRTLYPTDSFAVSLNLHHAWTYVFVNLGLGTSGSSFNISLTPSPLNVTGKGNLCLSDLDVPTDIKLENGMNATIQVVTVGESGSALYNCADITFSSNGTGPSPDQCSTTAGITIDTVTDNSTTPAAHNHTGTTSGSSPNTSSASKSPSTSLSGVAVLAAALGVATLLSM